MCTPPTGVGHCSQLVLNSIVRTWWVYWLLSPCRLWRSRGRCHEQQWTQRPTTETAAPQWQRRWWWQTVYSSNNFITMNQTTVRSPSHQIYVKLLTSCVTWRTLTSPEELAITGDTTQTDFLYDPSTCSSNSSCFIACPCRCSCLSTETTTLLYGSAHHWLMTSCIWQVHTSRQNHVLSATHCDKTKLSTHALVRWCWMLMSDEWCMNLISVALSSSGFVHMCIVFLSDCSLIKP